MLKAMIACAGMFISVDAGPMHIAVAFDVPTIDILGPAPDWVAPRETFVRAVSNRGGVEPAMHPLRNREFDFAEARRQSEAITVQQVTDTIDALCAEHGITRVS
jgi:ADP-heptose:LPS heptosyltransferase